MSGLAGQFRKVSRRREVNGQRSTVNAQASAAEPNAWGQFAVRDGLYKS